MAEVSMREAYGRALASYGATHPSVVALDVDTSASTLSSFFAKQFPERFFNVGIAEPAMVDVAVGLALGGMIPFANAFACLLSLRALEQVRTSVCYAQVNVKLAAHFAGLSDYKDGATHYSFTDLANMRTMPNLTVVVPADADEAAAFVPLVAEHDGPVYLRISRATAIPAHEARPLAIGRGLLLRPGADVTLVAMGAMVGRSVRAAEQLAAEGLDPRLIEIHTLKPLDRDLILQAAEETGALVTVEEHSVIGGLGGAIAEALAGGRPAPLERVGILDRFCPTGRDPESLLDACGLSEEDIRRGARRALERKAKGG